MKELETADQDLLKSPERCQPACPVVCLIQSGLDHLDIPVAEFVPHKVVDFLDSDTEFKFIHILCHGLHSVIEAGQDPLVLRCDRFRNLVLIDHSAEQRVVFGSLFGKVHHNKSGSVPYLVGEVSVGYDSLVIETHVISGRVAGDQRHAERVSAVIGDDLQRIDTVAERLGHLASQGISDKTVEKNSLERSLTHLLVS